MGTIRLVAEDTPARWPVVKNTKAQTIGSFKKSPTKVLIKPGGGSKFVIEPVHENCDVTLFLVLRRVVRGEFIGRCNQELLKIGLSNLSPILDVSERLFIADPISHTSGIDVRANSALAAIIDH